MVDFRIESEEPSLEALAGARKDLRSTILPEDDRISEGKIAFKDADLEGVGTVHGLAEARHSLGLILLPPLQSFLVPSFSSVAHVFCLPVDSYPGTYEQLGRSSSLWDG
uniref:Uncharacterized protein n=1 Tax=Vespula pensylvanica TaxID=30213 RepID=A0A834P7N0_VESPE|nr:hypothetical protein H0235_004545 [Vespula pensylvanica]